MGNQNGSNTGRAGRHTLGVRLLVAGAVLILSALSVVAQPKRLVVVKCDGLPYNLVERFVKERDPLTGKSTLPWIEHIFYQRGSRLSNFYVRGMSLSAPSWSMIDTGQHLQLKGNVEFDRYTLHSYDYLNFWPLYVSRISNTRIDMPAVEVLDSLGMPLLPDAYPHDERYITFSLFLRGARYSTLQGGLQNRFMKSPKELFDEWTMGFELRSALTDQLVRELVTKLEDPKLRYLDLFLPEFDHIAHHNNDSQSQRFVLKQIDGIIGKIWTAINKTPAASETALVVVSDHGFNTDERFYSQGFNLVKLLGSRAGGGHHVITKRRLMMEYSIKGINPMVPLVTTTTSDSYYLKGQSTPFPTAMLDFDGNERASIQLRNSDLNELHILLQELQRKGLSANTRTAITGEFFATLDRNKPKWIKTLNELNAELGALRRSIEEQRKLWEAQPKKFTPEERQAGKDEAATRVFVQYDRSRRAEREYTEYVTIIGNLVALSPNSFDPLKLKIDDVIPQRSMGDRNTIYQLQNYTVGVGPNGLVIDSEGKLDPERSFVRLNYFSILQDVAVRNVQRGLSTRPVDLIATRIPTKLLPQITDVNLTSDAVWINGGPYKQALLLFRTTPEGQLSIRYQPIRKLTQSADGRIQFDLAEWQAGFPLRLFEDPKLKVPVEKRTEWLSQWHNEYEWLQAIHETNYSNGLIGLHEELTFHPIESLNPDAPNLSEDQRLNRRFARRQRELCEADFMVVANDHWNFDVRGFNPGGNHGSFFRISTHSVFMIAGGKSTQIPQAYVIEEPYDSLSFVPTLLALTGNLRDDSTPVPTLWEKGFRRFPGRVVKELLPSRHDDQKTAESGVRASP